MLFVLGVIVGKRIESRGRAEAPEISDPLAVLDRAGQPKPAAGEAPREELTFPKTLIRGPSKGRAPAPLAAHAPAAPAAPKAPAAAPKAPPPIAPKPVAPVAAKVPAPAAPKPAAPVAVKPPPAAAPAAPKVGKFTLHLGAYPTKEEADAQARKYAAQGAFVVAAQVPEKGTVYRVRCGNFPSYAEATAAKSAFEKQTNSIALVASK
jgi:cell division septation protein DedD